MCRKPIETMTRPDGTEVQIFQDEFPTSPREWDNLGTMVCFQHPNLPNSRYDLGDKHGFRDAEKLVKFIGQDDIIALPLYLYDHSGLRMNVGGFSCPWDSGQVGYIYVTKEAVRKEWKVKRISAALMQTILGCLRGEVETYDQYLSGEVYGWVAMKECPECHKKTPTDSVWGYFGNWKESRLLRDAGVEQ